MLIRVDGDREQTICANFEHIGHHLFGYQLEVAQASGRIAGEDVILLRQ